MKLEMRESKVNSLRMMQERARKLACAHQEASFLRMKLEMCVSKVNSPPDDAGTCRQPFPPPPYHTATKHDAQARKLACAHQLHEERDGRPAATSTARTLPVLVPLCLCCGTKPQRACFYLQ
jgi:hypothetical protein